MKNLKTLFSLNNKREYNNLHTWNISLAVIHALQGVLIVVLSKSSTLPVSTNYLSVDSLLSQGDKVVLAPATRNLFDVNLAYIIAAFFFMSAIAHVIVGTVYRQRYEASLKKGINRARWIEYSISASTMMVAIALLSGVYDLSSLLMIFSLTAIMSLMGLAMELWNQKTKQVNWFTYIVGCFASVIPWIVFGIYVWGSNVFGSGHIPTFVYWAYVTMLILFTSFALNMYLQYKKQGKWADYLYGERVYMVLSLVAKTLLAWIIFAGTLRP